MEKINLDLLKIILTPRELKNITGGTGLICPNGTYCTDGNENI